MYPQSIITGFPHTIYVRLEPPSSQQPVDADARVDWAPCLCFGRAGYHPTAAAVADSRRAKHSSRHLFTALSTVLAAVESRCAPRKIEPAAQPYPPSESTIVSLVFLSSWPLGRDQKQTLNPTTCRFSLQFSCFQPREKTREKRFWHKYCIVPPQYHIDYCWLSHRRSSSTSRARDPHMSIEGASNGRYAVSAIQTFIRQWSHRDSAVLEHAGPPTCRLRAP